MPSWDRFVRTQGLIFVVSGPSGVGKDAMLKELEKIHQGFRRVVTLTTRPTRPGETDGVDYFQVSIEDFRRRVEEGFFLEYAEVHDHLYGTPREPVEKTLAEGLDAVLKIDVQGGLEVRRRIPDSVLVFIAPPSLEELENRLRSRLTESEAQITRRLLDARRELEQLSSYDYVIVNDSLPEAAQRLKAVFVAEHCRIRKQ